MSISKVKIDNTTHEIIPNGITYCTCNTAEGTAAKVATVVSGNFSLFTGARVVVKFTNKNSASSPTLNVGGTGAKAMRRYGSTAMGTDATTSGWIAGAVQAFTYDGTAWVSDYWNNTTYSLSKSDSPTIDVDMGSNTSTMTTTAKTTVTLTDSNNNTTSIILSDTDTIYTTATQSYEGLMSASDKTKLDTLKDWFGTGEEAIPANSDLDTYTIPGKYYCGAESIAQSLINCPTTTNFTLYVFKRTTGQSINQMIIALNSKMYVRGCNSSGVFRDWKTYATTDEATTSIAGLMSAADKTKLNGIATGANKITVDTALSSSSTNPVQNKVINTALAGKAPTSHTHTKSQITDFPTSMPASDVSAWAKAANKPTYTASEVGAVSKIGDTMTGDLEILKNAPSLKLIQNSTNRQFRLWISHDNNIYIRNELDDNNRTALYLKPETEDVANMFRLQKIVDGTPSYYNIFGQHNITAGTTALTSGTSALATGSIYQQFG